LLLRLAALLISAAAHGAVMFPLLVNEQEEGGAFDLGEGEDIIRIETGLNIEGISALGDAERTVEEVKAQPLEQTIAQAAQEEITSPRPPEGIEPIEEMELAELPPELVTDQPIEEPPTEIKPPPRVEDARVVDELKTAEAPELSDVITSSAGAKPIETRPAPLIETVAIAEPEETPPEETPLKETLPEDITLAEAKPRERVEELRPAQPEQVESVAQLSQIAVRETRAAGAAMTGAQLAERRKYLGQLRTAIEKNKVTPTRRRSGTRVVRFTINPDGTGDDARILTSGGSKWLDDAALKTLEKATPFPPFPDGALKVPLVVDVPFRFSIRKRG